MRILLLCLFLVAKSTEAFYPDGIDGPEPQNDRDGDSKYDIPHIFFQPNTDISTIVIASSVPSDAPSLVPTSVSMTSLSSSMPSDMPSLVPSAFPSTIVPTSDETPDPTEGATDRIDNAPLITGNPTVSPTPVPTSAPTPTPSIEITGNPTVSPTPVPTSAPTLTPSIDGTGSPTKSMAPTMSARFANEISDLILPSLLTETRTSKHRFQWGGTTEGCTNQHPPVFISCGAGGFLNQIVGSDAVCEELSNDRARCESTLSASDEDGAYVDFQCSGVTKKHLTATAEVFPSTAENCSMKFSEATDANGRVITTRGGNAAVFGVLGRVCKQNNGETRLENIYDCNEGTRGLQGDISYCASGSMCAVDQACSKRGCDGEPSCSAEIGAVSMSDADDREACSFPEYGFSLVSATFLATRFATYHEVQWTFSGAELGCRTFTPDLTLQCKNGEIKLGDTYPYCLEDESGIICTNPFGSHDNVRETITIKVFCLGDSYDQLELSASIPELNDESSLCTNGSLAIHGLTIQKECSGSQLVSSPEFCVDSDGIHPDDNLCYSKFECKEDTCQGPEVIVPPVSAVATSPETRYCIRAA